MKPDQQLADKLSQIGRTLYQARHARNEKLSAVASSVGLTHGVISQIENGRYESLSVALLFRLTNYYNLAIEELLIVRA